ncbi:MAG: hypothetical protein MR534_09840, partial [Prevotellaceae bacterium]|nr:hypothetical protein [Prevotellaceae bacterium]
TELFSQNSLVEPQKAPFPCFCRPLQQSFQPNQSLRTASWECFRSKKKVKVRLLERKVLNLLLVNVRLMGTENDTLLRIRDVAR